MHINHSFRTMSEHGYAAPGAGPESDYLVVYTAQDGDVRTRVNKARMLEELHADFGPSGYHEFTHEAPDGTVAHHLAIPNDVLALLIVCRLIARIKDKGWIDEEDWDHNMELVRETYWSRLSLADRTRLVLTHGGPASEALGDQPPTDHVVRMYIDLEARGFD